MQVILRIFRTPDKEHKRRVVQICLSKCCSTCVCCWADLQAVEAPSLILSNIGSIEKKRNTAFVIAINWGHYDKLVVKDWETCFECVDTEDTKRYKHSCDWFSGRRVPSATFVHCRTHWHKRKIEQEHWRVPLNHSITILPLFRRDSPRPTITWPVDKICPLRKLKRPASAKVALGHVNSHTRDTAKLKRQRKGVSRKPFNGT